MNSVLTQAHKEKLEREEQDREYAQALQDSLNSVLPEQENSGDSGGEVRPPDNNSTAYSLVHDDVPLNDADIEARAGVRPAPWGNHEEMKINEYNGVPIIGGSRL